MRSLPFFSSQTVRPPVVSITSSYDLYDEKGCVAKIERDIISFTPSYKFFYEAEQEGEPFYKAVGSFSQRKFEVFARDGTISLPSLFCLFFQARARFLERSRLVLKTRKRRSRTQARPPRPFRANCSSSSAT